MTLRVLELEILLRRNHIILLKVRHIIPDRRYVITNTRISFTITASNLSDGISQPKNYENYPKDFY